MKKFKILSIAATIAVALTTTCFVAGCQKEEDMVYSCDSEQDALVKTNIVEIRTMTRQDCQQVDNNLKIPVYRAFTPQQKQTFWVDKLNETLEAHEWSELERTHIITLRDAVLANPDWFIVPHKQKAEKNLENLKRHGKVTQRTV
jgi:hypothetical protein